MAAAKSERGRFRSFRLAGVNHFLSNQRDHNRSARRRPSGGWIEGLSLFEASAQMLNMYGENGNGHRPVNSRKPAQERKPRAGPPSRAVPPSQSAAVELPAPAATGQTGGVASQASPTEIYRALLKFGDRLPRRRSSILRVGAFALRRWIDSKSPSYPIPAGSNVSCSTLLARRRWSRRSLPGEGREDLVYVLPASNPFSHSQGRTTRLVQGRLLEAREGAPKYCNLAGVEVPALLNVDRLMELEPGSRVFVCEGAPDTLILEQEGFPAVGIIGSSGYKGEWVGDLAHFRVHLVLDNDAAGRSGTDRTAALFHDHNLPVFVVKLPDDVKDANDFFLKHKADEFERLVDRAERREADLQTTVRKLLEKAKNRGESFSYTELANRIYSWMESHGGVFLVDDEHRCFLMFDQTVYEIGNHDPFNAFMLAKTDLVPVSFPRRMVWQILRSLCLLKGRKEGSLSWIHTDGVTDLGIIPGQFPSPI